jgi:hypothetical protein
MPAHHDGGAKPRLDAIREPNEALGFRFREFGLGSAERLRPDTVAESRLRHTFAHGDDGTAGLTTRCERRLDAGLPDPVGRPRRR